jgi:hypothetical protein
MIISDYLLHVLKMKWKNKIFIRHIYICKYPLKNVSLSLLEHCDLKVIPKKTERTRKIKCRFYILEYRKNYMILYLIRLIRHYCIIYIHGYMIKFASIINHIYNRIDIDTKLSRGFFFYRERKKKDCLAVLIIALLTFIMKI